MLGDIIEPTHLLFILVVALVVLGPKRLPEVGRQLGRGLRDFREGIQGIQHEAYSAFNPQGDSPHQPPASPPGPSGTAAADAGTDKAVGLMGESWTVPRPEPHFVIPARSPSSGQGAEPSAALPSTGVAAAPATEPDPADYAD
ncbi:MAG: Sec-independent protein translocase subunit TatA/TatB [Solirubrobacteraceae bacterium]